MEHIASELRVGQKGRVVLPAKIRKDLGIEVGDTLVGKVEGDQIVIKTRGAALKSLKSKFASGRKGTITDSLIAERRAEAKKESSR